MSLIFGDCGMLSVTVADHNRGEMIFGSLELMEWPVTHDLKGVFYLEIHRSEGNSLT